MTVTIRQLHPHFFGEVSGVDLRKPLTPQEAADIEAGMDKYAVLLFRNQDITDEQQLAFALNFGERENRARRHRRQEGRLPPARPGSTTSPTSARTASRCRATAAPICSISATACGIPTVRSARSRPNSRCCRRGWSIPKGGNTEFADMRAAYDALDDETKAEIEDMICEHSLMYSRGSLGFLDYTDEEKAMFKPVLQRLVRTHPVHRPQVAVSVVACRRHQGHERAGGAAVAARSHRARHAARNSSMSTNGRCMTS